MPINRVYYINKSIKIFTVIICSIAIFSCQKKKSIKIQLGFYDWRMRNTGFNEDRLVDSTLIQFKPNFIYAKIMDIDWDDNFGYYPTATKKLEQLQYQYTDSLINAISVIPCVFITNKTLEKIQTNQIADLGNKIFLKTNQLNTASEYLSDSHINLKKAIENINELMIDCDWTISTKDKYFLLLTELQKQFKTIKITSTLRLHQYKNTLQMGIPPVKEVYLMCYNTGEVKKQSEVNSIFNYNTAKNYFKTNKAYPLKINIALPVFEWVVIFKSNVFYKIDNNFNKTILLDTNFIKAKKPNEFVIQKDTVINNNFLRAGDVLRVEAVNQQDLLKAAELCKTAINTGDNIKITFFDIQHINPTNYETVEKAIAVFRN